MANAAASGPAGVRLNVQLAVRVAQEIETVNQKLCDRVLATIEPVQSDAAVVLWSQSLAVRSQMALVEMRSPVAELLGRVIDGSLASGANGAKLHFSVNESARTGDHAATGSTAVQAANSGCSWLLACAEWPRALDKVLQVRLPARKSLTNQPACPLHTQFSSAAWGR